MPTLDTPDASGQPGPTTAGRLRRLSLRTTLIVAALCALAMLWLSEDAHQRIVNLIRRVDTVQLVRTSVSELQRDLVQAESSQRGFILTGDRKYLQPYEASVAEVERLLTSLVALVPREIDVTERLLAYRSLVSQKLGEMALTMRMREQNGAEVVQFAVSSDVAFEQAAKLRVQGNALIAEADAELMRLRDEAIRLLNVLRFGLAAGIVAGFFVFFLYVNQTRALRRADVRQQQLLKAERDALETQVRERTSRLTELATHLQQAVEDERAHLARELHDELGALLTAAKLDVARLKSKLLPEARDQLDRLKHLTDTLNQGIALKRRIIEDLRPSSLSNLGLVAALDILSREFAERSAIQIDTAFEPVSLDSTSELSIYRVVQEALTNIGKYAQARTVRIELTSYINHIEVSVTDDGVGFEPHQLSQGSHGLAGMRHRLEAGGGRLDIESTPGRGTRIAGYLPRRGTMAQAANAMFVSAPSYIPPAPGPTGRAATG